MRTLLLNKPHPNQYYTCIYIGDIRDWHVAARVHVLIRARHGQVN